MPGRLHQQVTPRLIHPIQDFQSRAGLQPQHCRTPGLIDLDAADGTIHASLARAVLARVEGRADAADEDERGVGALWRSANDFARTNGRGIHVSLLP